MAAPMSRTHQKSPASAKNAEDRPPANDLWIAALCRQHPLPLLSRDRHFDGVNGIKRIGW